MRVKYTFHLKLINIPLNVLQYKFLTSGIVPVVFISIDVHCKFAVLPDVFILLYPHEQVEHFSCFPLDCIDCDLQQNNLIYSLSVIKLLYLGNKHI